MNGARLRPIAIVTVLALTVAANAFLIWAANERDASVVEPDYYRKAVAWDSTRALESRSAALGWSAVAGIGAPEGGAARVEIALADRAGAPLTGAHVRLEAIHNLEASRPVTGALPEVRPGVYAAALPFHRAGLWELRVDAERGADHFVASLRRDTGAPAR